MPENRKDRERLDNPQSPQYTRRDDQGQFKEVEDVGRAARADQQRDAEHKSRPGQGDRGDRDTATRRDE